MFFKVDKVTLLKFNTLNFDLKGIIMEVTRPLLLWPYYLVKWPVDLNILAASLHELSVLLSWLTCSSLLFLNISRAFILFWINVRRQQESTRTFSSSICQKQIAFGKNAASHRLDKIRKAEGKSSLRHRSVTCLVPQIYSIPNLI